MPIRVVIGADKLVVVVVKDDEVQLLVVELVGEVEVLVGDVGLLVGLVEVLVGDVELLVVFVEGLV